MIREHAATQKRPFWESLWSCLATIVDLGATGVTSSVIKTTELLIFYLPVFGILALVFAIAVAMAYVFRTRFARRWLMISMRAAGAILVLPLVLALLLLLLAIGCRSRPRVFVSPDTQHIAEYTYLVGFLGRDVTSVTVRKKWSIHRELVYQYDGPSDWTDNDVGWVDNGRLIVRYTLDQTHFQQCKTEAAGVTVQCAPITRGR